jgi:hypothetical protein
MKRLYMGTAIYCLMYLLAGPSLSFGQNRKAAPKSSCAAGSVAFKCPKGFKSLPTESDLNLALMFHKDYNLGLFVAAPESGQDAQKFLNDVVKRALAKFFPKESDAYVWKLPADLSPDKVSKYEIGSVLTKGFNGTSTVYFRYRRLAVRGEDLFVGYIGKDSEGKKAKEFFEGDGSADSMSGCDATVELIYSITGEKINEDDPPCVIVTSTPVVPKGGR